MNCRIESVLWTGTSAFSVLALPAKKDSTRARAAPASAAISCCSSSVELSLVPLWCLAGVRTVPYGSYIEVSAISEQGKCCRFSWSWRMVLEIQEDIVVVRHRRLRTFSDCWIFEDWNLSRSWPNQLNGRRKRNWPIDWEAGRCRHCSWMVHGWVWSEGLWDKDPLYRENYCHMLKGWHYFFQCFIVNRYEWSIAVLVLALVDNLIAQPYKWTAPLVAV